MTTDRPSPPRILLALSGLALAGLALWVRAGWLPLARHRFDGHEADYLRAFQGEMLDASTRLYPLLAGLYRALGALGGGEAALIGWNLAAGVAAVGCVGLAAGRRLGARAGLAAALLLALSPTHAFWSSSAYNVAIPLALLTAGCALGGLRGAPLYALACGMRIELALLAPAVAALGGWRAALGAAGAVLAWGLMQTAPSVAPPLVALPVNLPLTALMGPLGAAPGLALVALAATRRSAPLLLAAAWTHLVGAAFDDYGTRHGLVGGICLAVALAAAWAPGMGGRLGWRRWLTLGGIALSLQGLAEVARWYYADDAIFQAEFVADLPAGLPRARSMPAGCVEILDDPLAPASHWRARQTPPDGTGWPARACWGEERIHRAWTSRGLQDRALRMRRTYDLTPLQVLETPGGPRVIYEASR